MRDNAVRPRWAETGVRGCAKGDGRKKAGERNGKVLEERTGWRWRQQQKNTWRCEENTRKRSMFRVILIDDAPPVFCLSEAVLIIG